MRLGTFSLERMESAVEKVTARLLRATAALEDAGILYAVAGGNAVAAWVTRVDEAAVRNTRDVDILLRRTDLAAARAALESVGFCVTTGNKLVNAREAVHIVFAGEKVRPHEALPNPDVTNAEPADRFRILTLEALVQIKLTAFRDKDRTHLRGLLDVGLIDQTWKTRFPAELADRLQLLIDTPEG